MSSATRHWLLASAALFFWASCGYHMAGKADTLPETIETIAIPQFQNHTTEYKIEQYLTAAVVREFLSRTRYHVVSRPEDADAHLTGAVTNFVALPTTFDPQTGRASSVTAITWMHVALYDRKTGAKVYENPNFEHREQYEVSADPEVYFEERQAALERASLSVARTLVSSILEGF